MFTIITNYKKILLSFVKSEFAMGETPSGLESVVDTDENGANIDEMIVEAKKDWKITKEELDYIEKSFDDEKEGLSSVVKNELSSLINGIKKNNDHLVNRNKNKYTKEWVKLIQAALVKKWLISSMYVNSRGNEVDSVDGFFWANTLDAIKQIAADGMIWLVALQDLGLVNDDLNPVAEFTKDMIKNYRWSVSKIDWSTIATEKIETEPEEVIDNVKEIDAFEKVMDDVDVRLKAEIETEPEEVIDNVEEIVLESEEVEESTVEVKEQNANVVATIELNWKEHDIVWDNYSLSIDEDIIVYRLKVEWSGKLIDDYINLGTTKPSDELVRAKIENYVEKLNTNEEKVEKDNYKSYENMMDNI